MSLYAKKGEWVCTVEGQRVCRVLRNIHKYEVVTRDPFGEWQIPEPKVGDRLPDGFRAIGIGGVDIHIEGVGWASERSL